MGARLTACFWCCLAAHFAFEGAASAQAPVLRIRHKMADSLNGTPDFICSVSIERTERAGSAAPAASPPLRVEAGIIRGQELYARPSTDADTVRLREVFAQFARAGTGVFALYSRAVFTTANATFYDVPAETLNGKKLSRVDFAMPRDGSGYSLLKSGTPVTLGYSGSIWTDPDSLEVARLALQADPTPPELGLKGITQVLNYGHTSLAGADVLLPVSSDLTLQQQSGPEIRIAGRASDCRQYVPKEGDRFLQIGTEGLVTISTKPGAQAEPNKASSVPKAAPVPDLLPPKTRIDTILEEAIDERTTKEGSRLTFTIMRDIKSGHKVIVPKGSMASGHVTRIIIQNYVLNTSVKRYYLVGLQFDSIQVGNQQYPVRANLENVGEPAKGTAFLPYSHDPDKWGNFDDTYQLLLCPAPERDESFLGIVREFLRLSGKMRMYWSNQEPQR